MVGGVIFFFFKQKTAYEMVRSDWSSDVCSSDLVGQVLPTAREVPEPMHGNPGEYLIGRAAVGRGEHVHLVSRRLQPLQQLHEPGHDHIVRRAWESGDHVEDAHGSFTKLRLSRGFRAWYFSNP